MGKYNFSHLTQSKDQNVCGPIQDDEALFLYSIIRGCRLSRVLEIGGLNGYSSKNFLEALSYGEGVLYTCDVNPVPKLGENHRIIIKNAAHLVAGDLEDKKLDMVFFDCHDMVQMAVYQRLVDESILDENTIIALHDTNLHYEPYRTIKWGKYIDSENGYAHQPVERAMVNIFKNMGYDVFSISTTSEKHSQEFPNRHGITVCKKFKYLAE